MPEVKVKVKTTTEGAENVTKFGSDLRNMLTGFVGGAVTVGAATVAIKTLYDQLGKGAALVDARHDFDDLAASIGATGDAMRDDLGDATRGLMTDAEAMAGATRLMSLNLGLTSDQISELVGISADLGWQMEDLGQALNTQSSRSLASLGLGIDDVQARMAALEDQGYATNDAFRMALVEAAKDKIAIVGSAADETAGQMLILQNAIKDAGDQFAVSFSTSMAHGIGDAAGNSQALGDNLFYAADGAGKLVGALAKIPLAFLTGVGMQAQIGDLSRQLLDLGVDPTQGRSKSILTMTDAEQVAEIERLNQILEVTKAQQEQVAAATQKTNVALAGTVAAAAQAGPAYTAFRDAEIGAANASMGLGNTLDWQARYWSRIVEAAVAAAYAIQAGRRAMSGNEAGTMQYMYAQQMGGWNGVTGAVNESAAAVHSYTGAVGGAVPVIDEAAAAAQRMASAFSAEVGSDAAEGLVNEAGLINTEKMNEALYQQAEAAGATAAQLALLGVATGQFTQEQAQAALKAAIVQEQIRKIAAGVVSGDLTIDQAMGAATAIQTNIDATQGMDQLQALITEIDASSATVDVPFAALTTTVDDYINYIRGLTLDVDVNFKQTGDGTGGGGTGGSGGGGGGESTGSYIPDNGGSATSSSGSVTGGRTSDGKPGYSVVFNFNGPVTGAEDVKRAAEKAAKTLMTEYVLVGGRA